MTFLIQVISRSFPYSASGNKLAAARRKKYKFIHTHFYEKNLLFLHKPRIKQQQQQEKKMETLFKYNTFFMPRYDKHCVYTSSKLSEL